MTASASQGAVGLNGFLPGRHLDKPPWRLAVGLSRHGAHSAAAESDIIEINLDLLSLFR